MSTNASTQPTAAVHIDTEALLHNLNRFTEAGVAIAPVVKSNAYGHGAVAVSRTLLAADGNIPFLVVASYPEAVQLREADITAPILILGYVPPATVAETPYENIIITAVDLAHLKALAAVLTAPQEIHLKLDTGMNRYGIELEGLPEAIAVLRRADQLRPVGVFSHLCDAFAGENDFTVDQIAAFNTAAAQVTAAFPACQTTHLAATSGHPLREQINATTERIGIGLYGIDAFSNDFTVRPVLSFRSCIASVRTVAAGETVGYGRSWQADEERMIATLPVGYNEGVDRRLSNQGSVMVAGTACPIVGKVSMNATTIDITDCRPRPSVGETVEIISADPTAPNTAARIAADIGAVNYRVTTQIPAHLPRILD